MHVSVTFELQLLQNLDSRRFDHRLAEQPNFLAVVGSERLFLTHTHSTCCNTHKHTHTAPGATHLHTSLSLCVCVCMCVCVCVCVCVLLVADNFHRSNNWKH